MQKSTPVTAGVGKNREQARDMYSCEKKRQTPIKYLENQVVRDTKTTVILSCPPCSFAASTKT